MWIVRWGILKLHGYILQELVFILPFSLMKQKVTETQHIRASKCNATTTRSMVYTLGIFVTKLTPIPAVWRMLFGYASTPYLKYGATPVNIVN